MSAKQSIFIDNSENIDPSSLSSSAKRKRTFDDGDDASNCSPKPLKTSRMALTSRQNVNVSSRLSTPLKLVPATPQSAPILKPAGRTPPPKSCKTFGRRSTTIAKARPEPSKRSVTRPFSLATALAKNKPAPKPKGPASWFFDIHVDSEQEEMTNLMQHSTGVLDISDDEGKTSATEGRGKENVPPAELGIDLPRSRQATSLAAAAAARKASKMEEDRAPLGDLVASDYYPEDCNAFSYAVVYDDENESVPPSKETSVPTQATSLPPAITKSIASLLETATPPRLAAESTETTKSDAKIEIWESESASEKEAQATKDKTQSSP